MKRIAIISVAVLLAAAAAIVFLRRTAPPAARPNVLWITMDSFRADHLGCVSPGGARTPVLDELAAEGALFTQCVAQAPYTHISVPSMITAIYPYLLGIRQLGLDLDSAHVTLAEVLAKEGYFTCGILEDWPPSYYQGFEKLHRGPSGTRQKTQGCLQTLDELDDRPFFIWLYYWDPHAPYTPPEEHMRMYDKDYTLLGGIRSYGQDLRDATGLYGGSILLLGRINRGLITLTPEEQAHLIRLYDAEITFVDSEIGTVFDRLKELGLWDRTLIILSADHGEVFGEHGHYYHGHTLYEPQIRVPLIVKPPRSRGRGLTVAPAVRNMDIMPTVLDYCDVSDPAGIDGRSLRPLIEETGGMTRPTCLETHNLQPPGHQMGYRTEDHKLIYDLFNGQTELYDLRADPSEENDLMEAPPSPELEARLKGEMLGRLKAGALEDLALPEKPAEIRPEIRDRLRALGYVE
jgi:arylsulfatase A-like enzyme